MHNDSQASAVSTPRQMTASPTAPSESHILVAALWMLLGSTSMGSMNVVAKFVSTETTVTVMQMGMCRGFLMALGCFVHAKLKGLELLKINGYGVWLLVRAFFGFASSMASFMGIFFMPLSLSVVLYNT